MSHTPRQILLTIAVCCGLTVTLAAAAHGQTGPWQRDLAYLSANTPRGRQTGTPGDSVAAVYIADALRDAGLRPGIRGAHSDSTWFQLVSLRSRRIDTTRSYLALERDRTVDTLALGPDALLRPLSTASSKVEAPLVFIGYGLSAPEVGVDDLRGLDVHGKVVVYITGGPPSVPGPLIAHHTNQRWEALHRAGAIGYLQIFNPRGMDMSWDRLVASGRGRPTMALADPSLDHSAGLRLAATVNAAQSERLFAGSRYTFAQLLAIADSGRALPRFALPTRVRAVTMTQSDVVMSRNVVGVLPGTDSILRNQYVVLTAHFDHMGVGEPVNGDSVYHGTMDNGTGVAWLIQAARDFQSTHRRIRRSIVFLSPTGEEQGLLGSRYFAKYPTLRRDAIVANINLDTPLPLFPLKLVLAHGLDESDLSDDLRRVTEPLGLEPVNDPEPLRNGFVRSDQYSFVLAGVPVLSIKFGYALGSAEHQLIKSWRATRYHSPLDNLEQPMNMDAVAEFSRVYEGLIEAVANRDTRPRWRTTSAFRPRPPGKTVREPATCRSDSSRIAAGCGRSSHLVGSHHTS